MNLPQCRPCPVYMHYLPKWIIITEATGRLSNTWKRLEWVSLQALFPDWLTQGGNHGPPIEGVIIVKESWEGHPCVMWCHPNLRVSGVTLLPSARNRLGLHSHRHVSTHPVDCKGWWEGWHVWWPSLLPAFKRGYPRNAWQKKERFLRPHVTPYAWQLNDW